MERLDLKKIEWDRQAGTTEDYFRQICWTIDLQEYELVTNDIKGKLSIDKKLGSILDIGCGNGLILNKLKDGFDRVYGVDFSENLISNAKKLIPEGNFQVRDAADLPFENDQFDRVMTYSVFHYFPSHEYAMTVFDEMLRLCKKGGIIFVGDILDKAAEAEIKGNSDLDYEKTIPSIQRYSEWMFYDLNVLEKYFDQKGCKVDILSQPEEVKCAHYRKDMRIWV